MEEHPGPAMARYTAIFKQEITEMLKISLQLSTGHFSTKKLIH
jgi:hypothetical protein